tara:strand:- start:1305 stop:1457 length:153 start_codon:yes stop_codon:yes gene_type:complete
MAGSHQGIFFSSTGLSRGAWNVPNFEDKAEADDYGLATRSPARNFTNINK